MKRNLKERHLGELDLSFLLHPFRCWTKNLRFYYLFGYSYDRAGRNHRHGIVRREWFCVGEWRTCRRTVSSKLELERKRLGGENESFAG